MDPFFSHVGAQYFGIEQDEEATSDTSHTLKFTEAQCDLTTLDASSDYFQDPIANNDHFSMMLQNWNESIYMLIYIYKYFSQ